MEADSSSDAAKLSHRVSEVMSSASATSTTRTTRPVITLEAMHELIGQQVGLSDWVRIDQPMIDDFAQVTGDQAFIHVDPERAAATQFKGTIAHGLLTLSLLPQLMKAATPVIKGFRVGVNVGFDRVRFITPVKVGSRVRAHISLAEISERKDRYFQFTYDITIEVEGVEKPAASVRWLLGRWIDAT
jgi:acyl dehydratase